jgi:hypothetical protein
MIGHGKSEHRLGRNDLQGRVGDTHHALLAGMGFNLILFLREIVGYSFALILGALALLDLRRQGHL